MDLLFVFGLGLWVDEKKVVELHPLLGADDALIATEDILGVDMADHGVDEGIGDAVPGERRNIGITRGGSGDRTDVKLSADLLHAQADDAVEVVDAIVNLPWRFGLQKDLREHQRAEVGRGSVLVEQLAQRLRDGEVDDDGHLVLNRGADGGELRALDGILGPGELGDVLQVGAIAEIEDNPPVGGELVGAVIVADLDDVRDGEEVLLAAGARLDDHLGALADDLGLQEAVHHGAEGAEIDALGGCRQAFLVHELLPLGDDIGGGFGRPHPDGLADDHLLLGVFAGLVLDGDEMAAQGAVEAAGCAAVLLLCLGRVLAVAEGGPVF